MLDRLRGNWGMKLLALAIAFTLWATITGEDEAVADLDLPLQVELPAERMLAGHPPTTVTVRLKGPRTLIAKLDPVGLAVRLDLTESELGGRDVQLSSEHLTGLPGSVSVSFFDPDRLSLVIDRRMRRELPVEAHLLGEPSSGFSLYRTSVRPKTVLVEGPESEVAALTVLRTDPIPLDHRRDGFSTTVGAVPEHPRVRVVDPRPLLVRLVIDTDPIEMAFDDVPIVAENNVHPASISPSTLRVTLTGPARLLEQLTQAQIRAVVDTATLDPGPRAERRAVEAAVVDLPQDQLSRIEVKSVRPRTVSVRLGARSDQG